jgi:RNA polymerase sigma-70 factor, ECF subfamily
MMGTMSAPETRDSLLLRIRDSQDREAWYEFVDIYRPMVYRIGRRHGLQDADALNLVQEVLCKVERAIGRWVTSQPAGSFRRWLRIVARNAAIDAIRQAVPDAPRGGTSVQQFLHSVGEVQANAELTGELEREAFRWAARRVKHEFNESTWTAFWQTVVEGLPCAEAAAQSQRSVGAIYTARSRVLRRLKAVLTEFDWNRLEDGHTLDPPETQ